MPAFDKDVVAVLGGVG